MSRYIFSCDDEIALNFYLLNLVSECSCNLLGISDNQGCNKETGECLCKRNVIGRDCNQCIPEYWGLGDSPEGCKPCDCDPGGSLHNECDVFTGQCK